MRRFPRQRAPRVLVAITMATLLSPHWVTAFVSLTHPLHTRTRTNMRRYYFHPHFPSFESASSGGSNANADWSMNLYELERARSEFEHLVQTNKARFRATTSPDASCLEPAGAIVPRTTDPDRRSSPERPMSATPPPTRPPLSLTPPRDGTWHADEEDNVEPCVMLLTNAARRFRELELTHLEALRDSDESVDALVHLWTTERDDIAAHALLSLQSGRYQASDGLVAEQVALTALCRTYPGWAEPWTRLATLLFYQGRMEDALSAAEEAAAYKPWHFEALNVGALVLSHVSETCEPCHIPSTDTESLPTRAARLARQTLPSLAPHQGNPARHAWVDRAVALATRQLQCAEEAQAAARHQWQQQKRTKQLPPSPSHPTRLDASWSDSEIWQ